MFLSYKSFMCFRAKIHKMEVGREEGRSVNIMGCSEESGKMVGGVGGTVGDGELETEMGKNG